MKVEVYGGDHSPWVNAVLQALHEKGIEHSSTQVPPLEVFKKWGVLMPAVSIDSGARDDGSWEIESSQILVRLGLEPISDDDLKAVQNDERLTGMRQWIATMQERFRDYPHLYSGRYFKPHLPQPVPQGLVQRVVFYLGFLTMVGLFPVTLPLVFVLMRKVPR